MRSTFRPLYIISAALFLFFVSFSYGQEKTLREIETAPGALRDAEAHVQGICCAEDAIYAVFMDRVYKLDWSGNVLKDVPITKHAGDACLANDRLYVSMSTPEGVALYEYDLDLDLERKITLENCGGCDGIAFLDGRFYIGGPSTVKPHQKNLVLVYDEEFNYLEKGDVDYGVPTTYGPQSIAAWSGKLFFSFYVAKDAPNDAPVSVWVDPKLKTLGVSDVDGSNGWALAPPSYQDDDPQSALFLVARTLEIDGEKVAAFRWYRFNGRGFEDATERTNDD